MDDVPDAPADDVEALVFDLEVSVATVSEPDQDGRRSVTFDYHCQLCGGCILSLPRGTGPEDPATCKACGKVFGKYKAVLALCRDTFRRYERERSNEVLG